MIVGKSKQAKYIFRSIIFMVIDFFCLFLSIYLAYILRFDFDFTLSKAPPINIGFFLAAVVFKIVIFAIFKLYKSLSYAMHMRLLMLFRTVYHLVLSSID